MSGKFIAKVRDERANKNSGHSLDMMLIQLLLSHTFCFTFNVWQYRHTQNQVVFQ